MSKQHTVIVTVEDIKHHRENIVAESHQPSLDGYRLVSVVPLDPDYAACTHGTSEPHRVLCYWTKGDPVPSV